MMENLFIYLFIHLFIYYLFIYLFAYLFICVYTGYELAVKDTIYIKYNKIHQLH